MDDHGDGYDAVVYDYFNHNRRHNLHDRDPDHVEQHTIYDRCFDFFSAIQLGDRIESRDFFDESRYHFGDIRDIGKEHDDISDKQNEVGSLQPRFRGSCCCMLSRDYLSSRYTPDPHVLNGSFLCSRIVISTKCGSFSGLI